jgi:hypothetical protein
MVSDDGKVQFLHKVSTRAQPQNTEMKRIGSNTPLFRGAGAEQEDMASLLGGKFAVVDTISTTTSEEVNGAKKKTDTLRASVHMDAMAFGMGCCCLQITFQAKDVDESRFIFDQLAVMAPMYVAIASYGKECCDCGVLFSKVPHNHHMFPFLSLI